MQIAAETNTARKIVLVGHGLKNEVAFLKNLTFDLYSAPNLVAIVDTQSIGFSKNQLGLKKLCQAVGIEPQSLHNAGNDAAYTLRAMILAVCESSFSKWGAGNRARKERVSAVFSNTHLTLLTLCQTILHDSAPGALQTAISSLSKARVARPAVTSSSPFQPVLQTKRPGSSRRANSPATRSRIAALPIPPAPTKQSNTANSGSVASKVPSTPSFTSQAASNIMSGRRNLRKHPNPIAKGSSHEERKARWKATRSDTTVGSAGHTSEQA